MSTQRFIVCKAGGLTVRLNITGCYYCGNADAICSVCSSKADRIRASLARTAAKRDARAS